ncbi:MAG: hypothetical protein QW179_01200, partial [Candidatus Hadarchaeales archaeon]
IVEISGSSAEAVEKIEAALSAGKSVVVPPESLSIEEEAVLKQLALKRGVLFLGPGCKSSIVGGQGFGIWNSVRRGEIGIISTSAGGLRELACLLENAGISHALHVGGRDTSQAVGCAASLSALNFLANDQQTEIILVVTPPPTMTAEKILLKAAAKTGKPSILCFLGKEPKKPVKNISFAKTLEEAAMVALVKAGVENIRIFSKDALLAIARKEREKFGYDQNEIRGIFLGKMLCMEGQIVLKRFTGTVYSNVPLTPRERLPDLFSSHGNACIDITARELSERDPLLDPTPVCRRMLVEAKDWETAVIGVNLGLGNNAHPNPAKEAAGVIEEVEEIAERDGRHVSVVVRLIGTKKDPQNLSLQEKILKKAGAIIARSNAEMMRLAAAISFGRVS